MGTEKDWIHARHALKLKNALDIQFESPATANARRKRHASSPTANARRSGRTRPRANVARPVGERTAQTSRVWSGNARRKCRASGRRAPGSNVARPVILWGVAIEASIERRNRFSGGRNRRPHSPGEGAFHLCVRRSRIAPKVALKSAI